MNRTTLLVISLGLLGSACVADLDTDTDEQDLDSTDGHGGEPHDAQVMHDRGHARPGGGGGSPNLTWHGGPVMTSGAHVEAIYWGASWSDPTFVADKQTGLASFYGGMGNTNYDATNSEYTDGTGNVGSAVTWGGAHVDTSSVPRNPGSKTSTILTEVCAQISNPVANGYYPVYVDAPRGHAGYCAWHSAGTCGGVTVQIAFFFDLDGDTGCDPDDAASGHSQGLAALANVSGHELSEALTDPHLNAWYDSSGAENSDKCAWAFGPTLINFGGGSQWKIQGNWSNAAFNSPTRGYANNSGQKGCLDGGTYN